MIMQSIKFGLLDLLNRRLWTKVMLLSVAFICVYGIAVFNFASPVINMLNGWLLNFDWLKAFLARVPFLSSMMTLLAGILYFWLCMIVFGVFLSGLLGWLMMPWVLQVIEERYKLEKKGDTPLWVELKFSLMTAGQYMLLMLLSLPILFVPLINILLPFVFLIWYLSKTMRFDALVEYASGQEYQQLCQQYKMQWLKLGLICAVFSLIPLLGQLLMMVFTPLCFAHFALAGLQKLRNFA